MRHQPARKLEAHRKQKVAHEAKRARKRQQATAHQSTPPASQRGNKHQPTAKLVAPLKVWNGVRVANLGKRLDEVWQGIESKINKLSPDFEESEKAA